MEPYPKIIQYTLFLLLMTTLMSACTGQPTAIAPVDAETNPVADDTLAATSTPIPIPTALPDPLTLFLADPLPADIFIRENLAGTLISDDPYTSFWFGMAEKAPKDEVLQTTTWVYALAAPFPTLTDDVTLAALNAFWQGNPPSALSSVTKLLVPENLVQILDARWGNHDIASVITYAAIPDPDTLWDENAWVILPFNELTPRLKVISVDGISPLFKDFNPKNDPLTVQYQLIQNQTFTQMISDTNIQTITNAIRPTNRDPEKMTTLVMTGVTALVRATAYRMEIHGVRYPGEEIVRWLSEADLTHISNEVSFYEDCPFPDPHSGMLLFCSNPQYIELFEFIGADIIELTGNHNNDALYMYGVDVVPFTLDLYQQKGMTYFGGGLDLVDARSPLLVTHNGNQLAFIGCNAPGPDFAWATENQGGAAPCEDYQWMADEVSRLKSEGYLPIATFQYYEDYYNLAEEHHVRDFGLMAEAGAVIVNGSQAHRPKAMTFKFDTFIDYGLGNLFFDQMGYTDGYGNNLQQVRWEIIQRHTFYEGHHLSTELLTAMLEDYAQPRPMTIKERATFLEELFTASGWDSR